MIKDFFKSLLFVFVCAFCVFSARAAVSLFSDYGQIQNVQHYSSNPFWSPTAPYNQRLPQPVYATGADLNADDCIQVVQSLVSVQCMARDNCKNTDVSDIRPTIMVQLSNLPGANYVSSCSGYIDEIFESYKRQYGNTLPNRPTAFPNATTPNPDLDDTGGIKFENPYKQQPTKWQIEQKERADELQRLQAQNGVGSEHLVKTDFPATYADLSFSERLENDRAGLEPFKDLKAYNTLDVKSESEWCEEHYNSSECTAYRKRKEAAAQAAQTKNQQNANNSQNSSTDSDSTSTENGATEKVEYVARVRKRHAIQRNSNDGAVDTDGKGCYAACGQPVSDNLNNKALHEVMGKNYCARTTDGLLVENENRENILKMNQQQLDKIKGLISSRVLDKDKCDGHFRNYIMFVGKFASDGSFTELEEVFLDD